MPPIKGRKVDTGAGLGGAGRALGLPVHHLSGLLDTMDASERGTSAKRAHGRWPFRQAVRLTLEHPGGSTSEVRAACRNLSRAGASVMHSSFVHTGTGCSLWLPRLAGGTAETAGRIVRCAHVTGQVHELGVLFAQPVDLAAFVDFDPLRGQSSFERLEPSRLTGRLLALMAGEIEERVLAHYISESRMSVVFGRSAEEAAEQAREGCDAVVLDISRADAGELVSRLREEGLSGPVVAIGPSTGPDQQRAVRAMGARAFVLKPLTSESLLGALAECLLTGDGSGKGTNGPGRLPPAVARKLAELVGSHVTDLRGAMEAQDAMRAYICCQQIKGVALQLGQRAVSQAAEEASVALAATMSTPEASQKVERLFGACERLRVAG